jgi:hypothetical protein
VFVERMISVPKHRAPHVFHDFTKLQEANVRQVIALDLFIDRSLKQKNNVVEERVERRDISVLLENFWKKR